jgi:Icc protein
MKLKIAILSDIHIGPTLQYQGYVRAASHLVANSIPKVLQHIVDRHTPDLLINLGDLIRSEEEQLDVQRYAAGLDYFHNMGLPVLHLLGNHELKKMTVEQVEGIWKTKGYHHKSYGSMHLGHVNLIWLGIEPRLCEVKNRKLYHLPEEQVVWLEKTLRDTPKPTLIFTHCPIDAQDLNGNFYYETFDQHQPVGAFLENQHSLQQLLQSYPHVKAVFQAHLHHFNTKVIDNIVYVTCPAMGDNISAPDNADHVSEIYTLLTIDSQLLTAKAYVRNFCFAGTETSME